MLYLKAYMLEFFLFLLSFFLRLQTSASWLLGEDFYYRNLQMFRDDQI